MNKQLSNQPCIEATHLDEIRATVDWQAMFAGLGLRKAEGKSKPDEWWAFSPFHDERTPSFHMNKFGLWYDFSVGFGGGPIELIQRLQGGNCYEAGRVIVERGWATCSLDLAAPVESQKSAVMQGVKRAVATPDAVQNAPIRQDLLTMCEYHPYLEERGISEETSDLLGIGFLPQGRSPLRGRIVFQVSDPRKHATLTDRLLAQSWTHCGHRVGSRRTSPKSNDWIFGTTERDGGRAYPCHS